MIIEYAGFKYICTPTGDGVEIVPTPGQHPATGKEKHIRAAREEYERRQS